MKVLFRSMVLLLLMMSLTQCTLLQQTNAPVSSSREYDQLLASRAQAIVTAYKQDDFETAHAEFTYVMHMLDDLGLRSDAEKVAYLDRHYPPEGWGLTYAIIREELVWLKEPGNLAAATASSEDLATIAVQGGLEDLKTADEDVLIYDRYDRDQNVPYQSLSNLSGREIFDGDLHKFIQKEIKKIAVEMGEPEDFKLPDDFVKEIEYYIRRFQNVEHYRKFFQRSLRRSRKYIPALRDEFTKKGFPEEVMYLAFIESGFNPVAYSRASAAGMFQFIKSTGKLYGLQINRYVDERYSPLKSVIACREYLHDLLLELGSFTMALSSYNSGAGKTRQALRQLDSFRDRNFWSLREKTTALKRETREYIPQIFAAIVMAKPGNVKWFGFEDVPFPDASQYRTIFVPQQVKLKPLADAAGISIADIVTLNPDLPPSATVTPAKVLDYPLFVPRRAEKKIKSALEKIEQQRIAAAERSQRQRTAISRQSAEELRKTGSKTHHRVRKGESLSVIAGKYGVSIGAIKLWNGLKGDLINVGKTLVIYQPGKDAVPAVADDGATRHRVRSGESLSVISDRYRVKIADLKRWNNLKSNRIIAGDVLVVRPAPSAAGTNGHQTADAGKTYHTVRSGESLSVIADRYRVKIADIKRWNSLRSNVIFPGNRLVLYPTAGSNLPTGTQVAGIEPLAEIPAGAERSRVSGQVLVQQSISRGESFFYAVSSGNTLSEIAQLFGVSVRDIQSWNRLSSTTLRVGQKLKIVSPRSMKFYKYRVQDGDNIGNIATQFDSTVSTIQLVNGKPGGLLKAGEILSIFSM